MPTSILVVDDNADNRLAMEALLSPLGTVVCAASGEDALRCVLAHTFAVILMDIRLGDLDGFETAAIIRSRPSLREVPIIFLTAFDDDLSGARRAYDLGAVDYITKPFDPHILRYKVSAFVRMHQQAEQLRSQAEALAARDAELRLAREAEQIRDVFLGVLSHDLRSPLNAIAIGTALLARDPVIMRTVGATVERTQRSVERMERLISDILDYTRGQIGGGIPITRERANLAALCRQILDERQLAFPERRLQLTVHGDPSVFWDPGRMAQVLSNLVGNALEHSDTGLIEVDIDATDPDLINIAIVNDGCIAPEILPRLFEPFRRGDNQSKGLGLGLFIVREIVRAHGGRVVVQTDRHLNQTRFVIQCARETREQSGSLNRGTSTP
jgi:two-component system, sensor histidine kinase and response regulator